MSIKIIKVCDGCGKTLTKVSETYKLSLKTNKFWNGVETDYLTEQLDFCYICAKQIKDTLTQIAEQMKGGSKDG